MSREEFTLAVDMMDLLNSPSARQQMPIPVSDLDLLMAQLLWEKDKRDYLNIALDFGSYTPEMIAKFKQSCQLAYRFLMRAGSPSWIHPTLSKLTMVYKQAFKANLQEDAKKIKENHYTIASLETHRDALLISMQVNAQARLSEILDALEAIPEKKKNSKEALAKAEAIEQVKSMLEELNLLNIDVDVDVNFVKIKVNDLVEKTFILPSDNSDYKQIIENIQKFRKFLKQDSITYQATDHEAKSFTKRVFLQEQMKNFSDQILNAENDDVLEAKDILKNLRAYEKSNYKNRKTHIRDAKNINNIRIKSLQAFVDYYEKREWAKNIKILLTCAQEDEQFTLPLLLHIGRDSVDRRDFISAFRILLPIQEELQAADLMGELVRSEEAREFLSYLNSDYYNIANQLALLFLSNVNNKIVVNYSRLLDEESKKKTQKDFDQLIFNIKKIDLIERIKNCGEVRKLQEPKPAEISIAPRKKRSFFANKENTKKNPVLENEEILIAETLQQIEALDKLNSSIEDIQALVRKLENIDSKSALIRLKDYLKDSIMVEVQLLQDWAEDRSIGPKTLKNIKVECEEKLLLSVNLKSIVENLQAFLDEQVRQEALENYPTVEITRFAKACQLFISYYESYDKKNLLELWRLDKVVPQIVFPFLFFIGCEAVRKGKLQVALTLLYHYKDNELVASMLARLFFKQLEEPSQLDNVEKYQQWIKLLSGFFSVNDLDSTLDEGLIHFLNTHLEIFDQGQAKKQFKEYAHSALWAELNQITRSILLKEVSNLQLALSDPALSKLSKKTGKFFQKKPKETETDEALIARVLLKINLLENSEHLFDDMHKLLEIFKSDPRLELLKICFEERLDELETIKLELEFSDPEIELYTSEEEWREVLKLLTEKHTLFGQTQEVENFTEEMKAIIESKDTPEMKIQSLKQAVAKIQDLNLKYVSQGFLEGGLGQFKRDMGILINSKAWCDAMRDLTNFSFVKQPKTFEKVKEILDKPLSYPEKIKLLDKAKLHESTWTDVEGKEVIGCADVFESFQNRKSQLDALEQFLGEIYDLELGQVQGVGLQ